MSFRSIFQLIPIITLFASTPILSNLSPTPAFQHSIGDMSISSLFETHLKFQLGYDEYQPGDLLSLPALPELEVYILFGTWCHDSEREVPRLLRLLQELNIPDKHIHLIGLNPSKSEPLNREIIFNVEKTPTFIFLKGKQEIGRIIEKPGVSLESDLQIILARY